MFVVTPDRARKLVEIEEDVRNEFESFDAYFTLEADDGSSLLAAGEGFGPFVIEWFPANRGGTHLKLTEELKRSEVLALMLDYFGGDRSGEKTRQWYEVENLNPGWLERMAGWWSAGPG